MHQCRITQHGSNVTKALSSGITHCWLTLACVIQLFPPGFVIMKSGKKKEATDFAVLHSRIRIYCMRQALGLGFAPADTKGKFKCFSRQPFSAEDIYIANARLLL